MTRCFLKINVRDWLGNLFINKLDPVAELILLRLSMMAAQAAGWVSAGDLSYDDDELARSMRVSTRVFRRHVKTLIALDLLGFDEARGAYFIPEQVHAAKISEKRRKVAQKGGGSPHLRAKEFTETGDLFKQKSGNVILFDGSGTSPRAAKKEKRTKKEKNNNNIYTPEKSREPAYFALGCIRLTKRDYQAWAAKFPYLDLDDELAARARWLETRPAAEQAKWFVSTQFALKNRNEQAQARYDARRGGAV